MESPLGPPWSPPCSESNWLQWVGWDPSDGWLRSKTKLAAMGGLGSIGRLVLVQNQTGCHGWVGIHQDDWFRSALELRIELAAMGVLR